MTKLGPLKLPLERADVLALGAVLAIVATFAVHWAPLTFWSPDALFYQARSEQIRGASKDEALSRVWDGPLAEGFRRGDALRPPDRQVLSDPNWVPYHYDLFGRRLLYPLLGAMMHPIAGAESLEVVAIIGMVAFALLLFALLRQRFSPLASAIAIGLCFAWPPIFWGFMPLTEGWALAILCAALLAALLAVERGREWLWVWAAAVLALGFTRDFTPVALAGAGMLVLALRNRRSVELGATGLLAALPAPLLASASLRGHYSLGGASARGEVLSWGEIADRYLSRVESAITGNFEYVLSSEPRFLEQGLPLLPLTVPIVAGIVIVLLARPAFQGDAMPPLMHGALLGGVVYLLLLPGFVHLRYELVFLPVAATGLAMGVDLLRGWGAARRGEPGAR